VWWLGNHHIKEVVVDQSVYMMGSHNWLSYRGDRMPRGESVFYVTLPEMVSGALNYLEPLFARAAVATWVGSSQITESARSELARSCVTLVTVRKPDEAIERVLDLAKRNNALIPLAYELLRVICLALAQYTMAELNGSKVFDSIALAISELSATREASEELDTARRAFKAGLVVLLRGCAKQDQAMAAKFLSEQVDIWKSIGLIGPQQSVEDMLMDWRSPDIRESKKAKKKKKK
jgi:hypothetical protein